MGDVRDAKALTSKNNMPGKLTNYLRAFRKRAGFSQKEISFLLGIKSGAKVSRYEHFKQKGNQ